MTVLDFRSAPELAQEAAERSPLQDFIAVWSRATSHDLKGITDPERAEKVRTWMEAKYV